MHLLYALIIVKSLESALKRNKKDIDIGMKDVSVASKPNEVLRWREYIKHLYEIELRLCDLPMEDDDTPI